MRPLTPKLLVVAGLFFGACQNQADSAHDTAAHSDTMGTGSMGEMMDRGDYSDARFFREMTAHHRMALDMTGMAQTMAASADLKAMAAKMQADQQREITEMTGMLQGLGETPDTSSAMGAGHEGMMGMPMTMEEMRAARPFDRAFLVSMIGHHSSAITMSAEAQAKSTNPDVFRLARAITTAQAGEIGRMQAMLEAMPPVVVSATQADSSAGQ